MSKILRVSLLPRLLFICGLSLGVGLLGSRFWDATPTLASRAGVTATTLPRPDHVVIVIEENHGFDQIIGAAAAPYINRLARQGALFTDAHGITHPSEPNYLALFSGSTQGVHDDSCPHSFSAPNLGRALLDAGLTFTGYSENLPTAGSTVCGANGYVRKHNPWVNFTNVPATANLPFDRFPTDYRSLPTVAVVVPTEDNDMHSGSIQRGDAWLQQHLDGYVQWAQTHNSLFILTWDEDDFTTPNQIPTLFVGPMVRAGRYAEPINHYHVLRTLEDLYSLPYAGNSATVAPIVDVWTTASNPTATPGARTATTTPRVPPTHAASPSPTRTPVAPPPGTPTRTPTPPPPATSVIRAAFYYPWFPEAWQQQGYTSFTHYHPALGRYNSGDLDVIRTHISAMQYGQIAAGIVSWWGPGSRTDERIPALLAAARGTGFHWALYYEHEGYADPSPAQIRADLTYMRDHYWNDPAYLRRDGRPVVFVYGSATDTDCDMPDRWQAANTVGAYLVLKVFPGYRHCANQPAGWHQYGPASGADWQRGFSYTISPGFWQMGQGVRLARNLVQWREHIADMVASGEPWQLITTFNEWGEGTAVEPAREWASSSGYGAYLDALHSIGPAAQPAGQPFTDVPPSAPFYAPILGLHARAGLSGYADGTFRPGADVTRGQVAKIVVQAAGYQDAIPADRQTFRDVLPGSPFWLPIEQAAAHGILSGYADGTFRPGAAVTRGQLVKMVANAAGYSEPPARDTFADVGPASLWYTYVERAAWREVVSGYDCGSRPEEPCDPANPRGYFRPGAPVTRGQTAKIVAAAFFPDYPLTTP
jgi:hypothetical protein